MTSDDQENSLWQLPNVLITQVKNKWYPLYFEHCKIIQKDFGLQAVSEKATLDIPIGLCSSIIIGPGVSITDHAIKICANSNCSIHWTSENGLSYCAFSHETCTSNKNALQQISLRSNRKQRLETVKKMFSLRYEIDVSSLTLKNMMTKEGLEVKKTYAQLADKYSVRWNGRKYNCGNFKQSDSINKAISFSNSILYSFCFSSILGMGYLPSIGFIHNGSMRDFALDIADIYKQRITLEPSFESISRCGEFNRKDIVQKVFREMENYNFNKTISKDITGIMWN